MPRSVRQLLVLFLGTLDSDPDGYLYFYENRAFPTPFRATPDRVPVCSQSTW